MKWLTHRQHIGMDGKHYEHRCKLIHGCIISIPCHTLGLLMRDAFTLHVGGPLMCGVVDLDYSERMLDQMINDLQRPSTSIGTGKVCHVIKKTQYHLAFHNNINSQISLIKKIPRLWTYSYWTLCHVPIDFYQSCWIRLLQAMTTIRMVPCWKLKPKLFVGILTAISAGNSLLKYS